MHARWTLAVLLILSSWLAASPVPCSPDGRTKACLEGGCKGIQLCVNGYWEKCEKTDLCCGVECDDGDPCTSDSCMAGACAHQPDAAACAAANASPAAVYITPVEVETLLVSMPVGPESDEVRRQVEEARRLEQENRTMEAVRKWQQISLRLNDLLSRQKDSNLFYSLVLSALAGVALVASAIFFAWSRRPRVSDRQFAKEASQRMAEIEAERANLIKQFMRREIGYGNYMQLMAALDKEMFDLQAKLEGGM